MNVKSTTWDIILWIALAAMWSSSYAVIKLGVATIDPVLLVAGRMTIGAAVIYAVMRIMGQHLSRDIKVWLSYAITGLLGSTIPFLFITYGEQSVDSALAAILMGVAPVATVVMASSVFPDERLTKRVALGIGCALVGVIILVGPGALGDFGQNLPGQLSIVAATLCYAASTIYIKRFVRRPALEMASGSMLCGAVSVVLAALLLGADVRSIQPTPASLGSVVYLGLVSTACANLIYFHLVPRMGATRMSQVNFAIPVGGSFIGAIFMGENMTLDRLAALAVIICAMYLVFSGRQGAAVVNKPDARSN